MSAFSDYLNELMEARGVTGYALAKATGISVRNIRRWRNGHHRPDYAHLTQLMGVLHGDVGEAARLLYLTGGPEAEADAARARLHTLPPGALPPED